MDDLESVIAEAKEQRKTAQTVETMKALQEEGVLPENSEKREVSAYERAAETITGGLHKVEDAKAVLAHANIPSKVVAPVLEIIIITESMLEELKKFTAKHTLDPLTLEENRIICEEAVRIMEAVPILLTAKDGFRSIQAVQNLQSLVTGESMMRANDNAAMGMGASRGLFGTIKNLLVGNKK